MSITMRAKMVVTQIIRSQYNDTLKATAVARSDKYPDDGSDENNTYARFSPSGSLELTIANPQLLGKIQPGQHFYLDFTPAEK